jgi:hypothetical protein
LGNSIMSATPASGAKTMRVSPQSWMRSMSVRVPVVLGAGEAD